MYWCLLIGSLNLEQVISRPKIDCVGTLYESIRYSYLFHVDLKGSVGLALGTGSRLYLLVLSLVERTQDETAAKTVVLDHVQLWQDPRAARHDTARTDQLVQVELPERGTETLVLCGDNLHQIKVTRTLWGRA